MASSSAGNSELPMFDYVKKFQFKFGREIFKDEDEIFKVEVKEFDNQEGGGATI
ncbi:hypothetical protein BG005_011281 [Podila minutissima]|nr:hypothetical protein BG005_011281 [Podila minutissima]